MKRYFTVLVVLTLSTFAGAGLVTFLSIPAGNPGSATNPLLPSQTIDVTITVDVQMEVLDAILTLFVPAGDNLTITNATGKTEAPAYGWSSYDSFDPIGLGTIRAEIGLATAPATPKQAGNAAKITIKINSAVEPGTATLGIQDGTNLIDCGSFEYPLTAFETPNFTAVPLEINYIPEPITFSMLSLGIVIIGKNQKNKKLSNTAD